MHAFYYHVTACNAMHCLSIKCMHCDKMKETWAHILIPHERSIRSC